MVVALAGCAVAAHPSGDGRDLAGASGHDLANAIADDLAGRDFAGDDLTQPPPPPGSDLSVTMCDPVAQTGCGPGEKCSLDSTGNVCLSDGTKPNGAACGPATDDCIHGTLCVGPVAMTLNCRQFCQSDNNCTQSPPPSGATPEANNKAHCVLSLTGSTDKVCSFACNPVAAAGASGCATGFACQTFGSMTIPEFTDCGIPGLGTDGASCLTNGNGDCAAGFVCVSVGATAHCRKACRANTAGDCTGLGGYACLLATGATMFGFCCPGTGC
jgi:hypothetical protein